MDAIYAVVVGVVFGCAVYLLLDRSLLRVMLGALLLSGAVNLGLFVSGRLSHALPPIIPDALERLTPDQVVNPLSQALILTAIVISFGLTAFLLTALLRIVRDLGTLDVDALHAAETQRAGAATPEANAGTAQIGRSGGGTP